jgi:hypothetical protein
MPSTMSIPITECILLIIPSTMSVIHTSIYYPDNPFNNEYNSYQALSGGCILVCVMLIVGGIIRRMYTGMIYTLPE